VCSEYPSHRSIKDSDGASQGVAGTLSLLQNVTMSTQPICGFDWNADKLGLCVCTAFDQTLRVLIVTKLKTIWTEFQHMLTIAHTLSAEFFFWVALQFIWICVIFCVKMLYSFREITAPVWLSYCVTAVSFMLYFEKSNPRTFPRIFRNFLMITMTHIYYWL